MKTREEILKLAKSYLFKAYYHLEQASSLPSNRTHNKLYRSHIELFENLALILDEKPWDLHQKLTGMQGFQRDLCQETYAMKLARISHLTTDTYSGMLLQPKQED